ncbi:Glyoxalase-like domain protein [Roseovarius sp. THAF27]|nr:Glyoxalase-like domain protein [Roseovarius sp. THAF27]
MGLAEDRASVDRRRFGIEIFEFPGSYAPGDKLEHKRHGTFHFAVQDPDVEGLAQRIVEAGGRQRMPIREYFPGMKPYRMVYVEDPFGIVFELYSHSYELTYSAGAYEINASREPDEQREGRA